MVRRRARHKRFTVTIDKGLYERVVRESERSRPRLPKRYVVELALERLFKAIDEGQMKLGLGDNARQKD
jgi:hypothetical protein